MRLAIFDFDGTIYRGETLRLFLRILGEQGGGRRQAVRRFYLTQWPFYLAYRLGFWRLRQMTRAMRGVVRMFIGLSESELEAYFRRCLGAAKPRFNPASLARLRLHLDADDRIILLSGTFTPFLAMVAVELGARDALGTDLVMWDGSCRGMGRHGAGPAKVEALRAFLAEREKAGEDFDLAEAYAYADGGSDLPLLSLVGHPVAVEPDKRLRREATRRGWEII